MISSCFYIPFPPLHESKHLVAFLEAERELQRDSAIDRKATRHYLPLAPGVNRLRQDCGDCEQSHDVAHAHLLHSRRRPPSFSPTSPATMPTNLEQEWSEEDPEDQDYTTKQEGEEKEPGTRWWSFIGLTVRGRASEALSNF